MNIPARLQPLGFQRLRLIDCLGGNSRWGLGQFDPAPDTDIFEEFRDYVVRLSRCHASDKNSQIISLLAAGRFLAGDLGAAGIILDLLPAEAFKTDHGAGYCAVLPLHALSGGLPLPPDLKDTNRWLAGSPTQAALKAWLAANRDNLRWIKPDGIYQLV
jgi:hypothetical protein